MTGTVVQYTYGDAEWKDLLTAYNGQTITYDEIGNPLTYRNGMVFSWIMGRQLHTAVTPEHSDIAYRYNEGGVRIQKRVDGVITTFVLDGTNVIAQNTNGTKYYFEYDANGQRHSMTYGGQTYYYYYNAQGDVIGLYDTNLNSVVQYTYDSWGKVLSVTGTMADTLGQANPFRYRGYYYDSETGLYYLNSWYYDPITGRFINADGLLSTGQGVLGYNMFAYCGNNPIVRVDANGDWWGIALAAVLIVAVAGLLARSSPESPQVKEAKEREIEKKKTAAKEKYNTSTVHTYKKKEGKKQKGKVNIEFDPEHKDPDGTTNPNIRIIDSYKITDRYEQEAIIDVMMASELFDSSVYNRDKAGYISEWRGHNAFHSAIPNKRVATVDLDEGEWIPWDWFW